MYRPSSDELLTPSTSALGAVREALFIRGHATLDRLVAPSLMEALQAEAGRLTTELCGEPEGTVISRDSADRVLSMHHLDRYSDLLFDLIRVPVLHNLAERLLGMRAVPFLTEYFAKPAVRTTATPAHQDQIFYRDHFGDELAVTFWIALDDVDEDSGVLQYAVEQPKLGDVLKHRESDVQNFGAELIDVPSDFVSAPVQAGGAVVHHSYAVHRSGPMLADRPRAAYALNYRTSPYRQKIDPLEQ